MFWKSTYNELLKIAYKPRSYIGIAGITVIIAIVLFAMKLEGKFYMSLITGQFEQSLTFEGNILNGNLIGFIILNMLIIHIPLLIAFVTGDLVSGEADMGTVRLLLTKPIGRTSILFSKFMAGCVYTFIIVVWLAFMAVVIGKALFGVGDLIVLNSDGLVILQENDLWWRFMCGFIMSFLSLVTVATLALTLSCFSDNSIGPIITTMGIILLFTVIGSMDIPMFDIVRPYMFTTHMAAWRCFFSAPVASAQIVSSTIILLTHIAVLLGIATYKFNTKDILS
jgi:ABC-2 type transport system permease protein